MLPVIAYTFIFCVARASNSNVHNHRISVVSSYEDPDKPAVFSHAESPVWDPDYQSLYFVDVHEQNVHRLDYSTGQLFTKHIHYGQVNVVALVAGSRRLLITVRSAIYLLDWEVAGDASLRLLTGVDHGMPDNVINEGKPDAHGRFWAGTKGPQTGDDVLPDKAIFFSIEPESFTRPKLQLKPVSISNGLVWSLNNSVLYYVDSFTQKIDAFDFDLMKGEISGRRTIIDITQHGFDDAIPDGMTIDSNGNLWVAIMFGGTVMHIDPDARTVIYSYKLPVTRVTSLIWGGPNLDELFVTTSRDNLSSKEQLAGCIFTVRDLGVRGVPPYSFRFENADNY